jgi:hypothetical protein
VSRLRPADYVAGIGGLVLLVSLWLKWYGFDAAGLVHALRASSLSLPGGDPHGPVQIVGGQGWFVDLATPVGQAAARIPDFSAWQSFSILDVVLFLIALIAIGVPVTAATTTSPAKPVAFTILGTLFSALAVLLILYRIVNQPGSNAIIAVKPGAWIGLAGAVVALVGSYLAMADEHTPGAAHPDIPIRPAP